MSEYKRRPTVISFPAETDEGFDPRTKSGAEKLKAIQAKHIANSAPVPGESVGKEVSPQGINLRTMRKIVGAGGVQGKHIDGNNQLRPQEEEFIWRETCTSNKPKRKKPETGFNNESFLGE